MVAGLNDRNGGNNARQAGAGRLLAPLHLWRRTRRTAATVRGAQTWCGEEESEEERDRHGIIS